MVGVLWVWRASQGLVCSIQFAGLDSWGRGPMDIESLGLVEALTASCEP